MPPRFPGQRVGVSSLPRALGSLWGGGKGLVTHLSFLLRHRPTGGAKRAGAVGPSLVPAERLGEGGQLPGPEGLWESGPRAR